MRNAFESPSSSSSTASTTDFNRRPSNASSGVARSALSRGRRARSGAKRGSRADRDAKSGRCSACLSPMRHPFPDRRGSATTRSISTSFASALFVAVLPDHIHGVGRRSDRRLDGASGERSRVRPCLLRRAAQRRAGGRCGRASRSLRRTEPEPRGRLVVQGAEHGALAQAGELDERWVKSNWHERWKTLGWEVRPPTSTRCGPRVADSRRPTSPRCRTGLPTL